MGCMRKCRNIAGVTFLTVLFLMASAPVLYAQTESKDAEWLIEVLEVEEGSTVAEIGAGDGSLTIEMARKVGPEGMVYTSELGADSVRYLQNVIKNASVSNVVVIKGHPTKTNFPDACCDALFMRRVYHHFKDPSAMNKSIWQSLKPGGRVAIIDFAPRGSESANPDRRSLGSQHGVTRDTVVDELREAGFSLISSKQRSGRNIYVVMEKRME